MSEVKAMPAEDMLVRQLQAHLREMHHVDLYSSKKQQTKTNLLHDHDRLHQGLRDGMKAVSTRDERKGIPHTHIGVTTEDVSGVEEDVRKLAEGIELGGEPLSGAQRRVMIDLVNGEFKVLSIKMAEMAATALEGTRERIREEHNGAKVTGHRLANELRDLASRWEMAVHDHRRQFETLYGEAEQAGVSFTRVTPSLQYRTKRGDGWSDLFSNDFGRAPFTLSGLTEALKAAEQENKALLERGRRVLERQRLDVLRKVNLASLTPEARAVMDQLPSAEQMLVAAQQQARAEVTA